MAARPVPPTTWPTTPKERPAETASEATKPDTNGHASPDPDERAAQAGGETEVQRPATPPTGSSDDRHGALSAGAGSVLGGFRDLGRDVSRRFKQRRNR